jgi:hypothetical protein
MSNSTSAFAEQENQVIAEYEREIDPDFDQSIQQAEAPLANNLEFAVNTKTADVHDFLKDEEERQRDRKRHIEAIKQDSIDREEKHQASIKELTDLHQHALAENAELLKKLGHVEPPSWVNPKASIFPAIVAPITDVAPPKRRGRPAGAKNAAKSATPVEPTKPKRTYTRKAVSVAPSADPAPTDKPKRTLSAERPK